MATDHAKEVLRHLRRAVLGDGTDLSDGQLLGCFIEQRDEDAFAALVRRHGAMVWGVCRRVLRGHQDAEDAFQATFLVLARKAASVVPRERVGPWLYGVAFRTAVRVRSLNARRWARERQVAAPPEPVDAGRDLWDDVRPLLDVELSRLPEKYRVPVVLCDLEGKTYQEAARQAGCPAGTLAARLSRARALLAKRLARHGLAVTGGTLATVLSAKAASAGVPPSVLASTITAATVVAVGQGAVARAVSAEVAALTEGVLKTMSLSKLKIATLVLLAVGLLGVGTTVVTYRTLASDQGGATNGAAQKATGEDGGRSQAQPAVAEPRAEGKPKAGDEQEGEKPPEGQAGSSPKVRTLLKERLAILKTMAERMEQLHKQNAVDQENVSQANLRVYRAELDLCETTRDRIAVREKIADVYREKEDRLSRLAKKGMASQDVGLEAKLGRLEAEIALEQEKAKLATPPK
jgi:RNA polymerase sigma factor (sigma-70 family)